MDAQQLFQEGKLQEAITALGSVLRARPADSRARTFLFELLCFAGDYERAEKQLQLLGDSSKEAALGVLQYRGALHAEQTRQTMFETEVYPPTSSNPTKFVSGTLNGKPFQSIEDADPRIGPRFELYAAGEYLWMSFQDIASIEMAPPQNLRDTLWAPLRLKAGPSYEDRDFGELLTPVIAPHSWAHPDASVALGRVSEWCADESGKEAPYGQKMLLVDGEEFPILEIRNLEIAAAVGAH